MLDATVDTKTDERFARIPNYVLDAKLRASTKLILIGLIQCGYGTKTEVWPSQVALADRFSLARNTVSAALKELEEIQVAEPVGRVKNGQMRYRLHLNNVPTCSNGTHVTCSKGVQLPAQMAPTKQTRADNPIRQDRARDVTSAIDSTVELEESENGEVLQTAQQNGPAQMAPMSPSKKVINENLLDPEGFPVLDDRDDLEYELNVALAYAGGEIMNGKGLDELVALRGVRYCSFWRSWLLRKIAAQYEADSPVTQPAALYVKAVREKWAVNPAWPKFDESKHRWAADIRETVRLEKKRPMATSTDSVGTDELPGGLDEVEASAAEIAEEIPF